MMGDNVAEVKISFKTQKAVPLPEQNQVGLSSAQSFMGSFAFYKLIQSFLLGGKGDDITIPAEANPSDWLR